MIERFAMLFEHERSALIEALRRDIRSEERRAESNPQDADYHLTNYRTTLRILETLHPQSGRECAGRDLQFLPV